MKLRWILALAVVLALGLLMQSTSGAGDKKKDEPAKDVVVDAELTNADLKDKVLTESFCKTYTYKMIEGRTYQIDMKTGAFDAFLRLENSAGTQVAADDDSGGMLNARIVYRATKTEDFTICCMSLGGGSTGKFQLIVKDLNIEIKPIALKLEKGQATFNGQIVANDATYNNKIHKQFNVAFLKGKTYQIDNRSRAFDAYLYLIGPDGNVLAQNDDFEGLDSRIVHRAEKDGVYQIIATSLGGRGTGAFSFSVRQTD
jgi:hypothetical protein